MHKFKVGDRVRLIEDYYQYLVKGEEGIITWIPPEVSKIYSILILGIDGEEDFRHFVHEDYIELI